MTKRQIITSYAHAGLALALVFMILEVEHIGKLWGHTDISHEFLITAYCVLLIGTMLSTFLSFKTRWAWFLIAIILFLYSGFAVPEGIEDFRLICCNLLRRPEQRGLLLLRLAFTVFLAVPFVLFLLLAVVDVRVFCRRWSQRTNDTESSTECKKSEPIAPPDPPSADR
jgi:hypothetical protein